MVTVEGLQRLEESAANLVLLFLAAPVVANDERWHEGAVCSQLDELLEVDERVFLLVVGDSDHRRLVLLCFDAPYGATFGGQTVLF